MSSSMASKEEESGPDKTNADEGGSWWQSWGKSFVDTVKEKTSSTYEMVQKDLSEFYQTIQIDTAHVVADTATKVQDQIKVASSEDGEAQSTQSALKQSFNSILTTVSESLKTLAQDEYPVVPKTEADSSAVSPVYNRRRAKIHQIQTEVGTYCNEPEGPSQEFEEWRNNFDFDSKRTEMSELLVKIPEIRAIYSRLVPSVISHATFWQRYFYKINQFELGEERRAALVARAETASLHEEELNWDSDDELDEAKQETKLVNPEIVEEKTTEAGTKSPDIGRTESDSENNRSIAEADTMKNVTDSPEIASVANVELEESKDERSFEILSPKTPTQTDVDANSPRKLLDESERVETLPVADVVEDKLFSSSSSHQSLPTKDVSSSGSPIEVSPKAVDHTDGTILKSLRQVNAEAIGDKVHLKQVFDDARADLSETASTSSWISVDDEIRIRRSKKDNFINDKESDSDPAKSPASNRNSDSSSSSAVLIEKSDCKGLEDDDNDDVDIDLDEDINEEELKKIMEKIKSKSGDLDDDNDWEDWE